MLGIGMVLRWQGPASHSGHALCPGLSEWRIGWQVSAPSKGHSPGAWTPCCLCVSGREKVPLFHSHFCLSVSSHLCPVLWQELLDSTFSWYHGASVFPLIPSQEDKEDEAEDEEPTTEKAKKKSPEEGSRPPPDLARHDVIKVEGNLCSHP